jgi:hypothetical protein
MQQIHIKVYYFFWRKRVLWCNLINWCPIQKWIGLQSVLIVCHSIMYCTRHSIKFDSRVNSNTWRDLELNLVATYGVSDHATNSRCNARSYSLVVYIIEKSTAISILVFRFFFSSGLSSIKIADSFGRYIRMDRPFQCHESSSPHGSLKSQDRERYICPRVHPQKSYHYKSWQK